MLSPANRQLNGRLRAAEGSTMRVLVATDAWHPQVNGVVRTLSSLARSAQSLGASIEFLRPMASRQFRCRPIQDCALLCRADGRSRAASKTPDPMLFILRPKGRSATWCGRTAASMADFSPRATQRGSEYIAARSPIPESWIYAACAASMPQQR